MKLLLLSDTHLGLQKASDIWLNTTLNLFKEVRDVCLSKNIDIILHLGDFFDEKKSTNQKSLQYAYEIADVIKPLKIIIVTGNHDVYYKEGIEPSSLKCFQYTQNVDVIKNTTNIEDLTLVPWKNKIPSKGFFCFGHFDINDFPMNNNSFCKDGISKDIFKEYRHVYSGHFHMPSSKDNITYIGSAFQQTFSDAGSSRGYYIWEDGEMEFIEYKSAPKFIKITSESDLKGLEGNIVKLIYTKDYGTNKNTKILEEVERQNPLRLTVDFTNITTDEEKNISDNDVFLVKHKDIIKEWVEKDKNIPANLNGNTLLKMIEKIMEEE